MDAQEKILLYHFTDIRNLPSIVEQGLRCDSSLKGGYVNSGNLEIKERRMKKAVPKANKTVGDYVPFYFAPRSPMLYERHVKQFVRQREIVYLVADARHLMQTYPGWCCSDRNAASFNAAFFFTEQEMLQHVQWDIMNAHMWNNTDDEPDRKSLRMAEFLVPDHVSFCDLLGVAVFDNAMERYVVGKCPDYFVAVRREWYFEP